MRIGTFRSLTKYNKRYAIFRTGKAIADGGEGVKWACKCGGDSVDPCKHLKCLWNYARQEKALTTLIDSGLVTLTLDGKKVLKVGY